LLGSFPLLTSSINSNLSVFSVKGQCDENLMTAKNLAVVFGPTLLRDQDPSRELLDMNAKNTTVEFIIINSVILFAEPEESA
jgi:hypothetical protein